MEKRATYYRTKKIFFLLCLSFLCSNQVKASETHSDSMNASSKISVKQPLLSVNSNSKTLSNSKHEDHHAGLPKSAFKPKKKHLHAKRKCLQRKSMQNLNGLSDAERLAGLISGDINFEPYVNRDYYYNRNKPDKLNAVRGFLVTLFYKATSECQPKRLAEALSIANINELVKMKNMDIQTLCAFIAHYLELDEVSKSCKKRLKKRIVGSAILPQNCCKSFLSISRSWGWSICCSGSVSLPLSFYISSLPIPVGIVSTVSSLVCGCFVANCYLTEENTRMRLVNLCIDSSTQVTCCQKTAMAGGPRCLEKCLGFIPFKGPSFSYWKSWIQDMQSVKYMFV